MKPVERKSFCFLVGEHCEEKDKELFFSGPPGNNIDQFVSLPNTATFPELLVIAGVFASKTEARNNGWGAERFATTKEATGKLFRVIEQPGLWIPEGFLDFRAGKGKQIEISIFKRTKPWIDFVKMGFEAFQSGEKDTSLATNSREWFDWWEGWTTAKDSLDASGC